MSTRNRRGLPLALAVIAGLALLGYLSMRPTTEDAPAKPVERQIDSSAVEARPAAAPSTASPSTPSRQLGDSQLGILQGRVIDARTQKPVREFELKVYWAVGSATRADPPPAQTFRADDGRFEWRRIPEGVWMLTASARGYQRFELNGLQVTPGKRITDIVMPLRRGQALQGRVYDEVSRLGITGASIGFRESNQARFEGNWRAREYVKTGKDGSFVLDGVPAGNLVLDVSAQGYAGEEIDVVVNDKTAPLQIGLGTGGVISGRLAAADGVTPIAGSAGLFNDDRGFGSSTQTDEQGGFSYKNLAAGRYRLTGSAQGATATREIVLARNERIEDLVLTIGAGRTIRGVVTGVKPEDFQGVTITVEPDTGGSAIEASARLDHRGAYELRGVQAGRVVVMAHASRRGMMWKSVQIPSTSDVTVNFEFPTGARLSGRVTRGGKPLVGIRVSPRSVETESEVHFEGTWTSERGEYAIENLPSGEYYVRVEGYPTRRTRISGNTVFDIDLPATQLAGNVIEAEGAVPVVGATVQVYRVESSGYGRLDRRSDHLGRFVIDGLEPGDFVVSAYKPGYELFRERVSYSAGSSPITIRLRPSTGVEIRVREAASGRPMRDIYVVEKAGDGFGTSFNLQLNQDGLGRLPDELAGSTLSLEVYGYAPIIIRGWDGSRLDLDLRPE